MSRTPPPLPAADPAAEAGEYVLGLLDAGAAADLEARLATDAALRQELHAAQARFLELDLGAEPLPVPANLWPRIEGGLAAAPPPAGRATSASQRHRPSRRGFWSGALAGAAVAAAVALVAILLPLWPGAAPPSPQVVAVLLDAEARPGAIVEAFADDSVRITPLQAVAVTAEQSLQVWTLYDPAVGPVSLGLLPALQRSTLQGPDLPLPQASQLYEITLEPAGGSPTGRPTGAVLFKGYAERPL